MLKNIIIIRLKNIRRKKVDKFEKCVKIYTTIIY